MHSNPLMSPIATILHRHPRGISEYALMRQLAFDDLLADTATDSDAQLLLFRKHFLVMNALYRLQPLFWDEGYRLHISALHIALEPRAEFVPGGAEGLPDDSAEQRLRAYYLDWSEFEQSSAASVDALLKGFWLRYANGDQRQQALEQLQLREDASHADIRAAFRRQAAQHHPDRGGDPEQFRRAREAYELLQSL